MPNYKNTYIYHIICKDLDNPYEYIGHTTNFSRRLSRHKSNINNVNCRHYLFPLYSFIRNNGGIENFNFFVLEKLSCNNADEARAREYHYIKDNKFLINTHKNYSAKHNLGEITGLCDICGKNMIRKNMKRHLRVIHKIF